MAGEKKQPARKKGSAAQSPSSPKKEDKDTKKDDKSALKSSNCEPGKKRADVTPEEEKKNKAAWAASTHKLKCKDISAEYGAKMKRWVASNDTYKGPDFELKNRYQDVLCIEKTRVVLKDRKKGEDFIHANWVTIPDGTKYICTQGPLEETSEDFYHMCHQESISIVLMLCNYREGGFENEKCSHYFPEKRDEQKSFGPFTVTRGKTINELEVEDVTICALELKKKGDDKVVKMKHVLMTSWPDQLAPVEAKPVLDLWRWVKKSNDNRPVAVHCSAGVGRTSTFVGFELANYRFGANPKLDLMELIKELRTMRYQSIQSHVQYLFFHVMLMEYFVQKKVCKRPETDGFIAEYRKHAKRKLEKVGKERKKKDEEGKTRPDNDREPPPSE